MPGGVRSMKGEKQMIYKNITFKADPFSYDLEFEDRITLVGGDSGTGKTVLYEMLEDIRLTDEYKTIKLFNYKSDDFLKAINQMREEKIDIIYLDPRYKTDFIKIAIEELIKNEIITKDTLIIIETDEKERVIKQIEKTNEIELTDQRKYGRANIIFLKKKERKGRIN